MDDRSDQELDVRDDALEALKEETVEGLTLRIGYRHPDGTNHLTTADLRVAGGIATCTNVRRSEGVA